MKIKAIHLVRSRSNDEDFVNALGEVVDDMQKTQGLEVEIQYGNTANENGYPRYSALVIGRHITQTKNNGILKGE